MGIIKKFLQDHQKTKRDNQIHSMKKSSQSKTAVILCGGKGTRLGYLGKNYQKHW